MKKRLLLLLLSALFLTSCNSDAKRTVKVKGKYTLELPRSFEKAENLNKDASLQYQDIYKDLYVIVIDEQKTGVKNLLEENAMTDVYNPNLKGYSDIIIHGIDPSIVIDSMPPFKEAIINGLKSRQVTFEGNSQNLDIVSKIAFIDGKNTFYQMMVWTSAKNRVELEKEMEDIVHSFKEIDRDSKQ
jgi:hypothetical protein